MKIDISLDVRSDVRPGADPDKHSKKLRGFHKKLWSKELPNGQQFALHDDVPKKYLFHTSPLGEFTLASDGIGHSLFYMKRAAPILAQLPESRINDILSLFYTVPGFTIFPGNQIDGKVTINAARGFNARICDRFDLTLECIRRHYSQEQSPLSEVLTRYGAFFALFETFEGYVDFFLLQDIWDSKNNKIVSFMPFDGTFPTQPIPKSVDEYEAFIEKQSDFLQGRALRMRA